MHGYHPTHERVSSSRLSHCSVFKVRYLSVPKQKVQVSDVKRLLNVSYPNFLSLSRRFGVGPPDWWRRRGSNSRPPACKAGALPAELRPRVKHLVGSRGLEPPTSRLSGVRSNRLSYEPVPQVALCKRAFKIKQRSSRPRTHCCVPDLGCADASIRCAP